MSPGETTDSGYVMNMASSTDSTPGESHASAASGRLTALDAYRGLVMMALVIEGYFPAIAQRHPDSRLWQVIGKQFVHTDWAGGVFWDFIQPSFMFIIGVAMTFSYFSRRAQGQDSGRVAAHVLYRSAVLVLLGWLIGSAGSQQTQFTFEEILAQIGLAYPFAYLLVGRRLRVQLTAAALILVMYWAAFVAYPLPSPTFDFSTLGIHDGGGPFTGLYAHWNKYTNLAYAFDRWFLNLFPRADVWLGNRTYGATLNFIPSIVTMLLGIMAGDALRSNRPASEKLRRLCMAGAGSLAAGLILGATVCPSIKALWTPSWVLVSGGAVVLSLAAIYWLADVKGWKTPLFPFVVVGCNSLAMYLMIRLCKGWVGTTLEIHAGRLRHFWSFQMAMTVMILWFACYWMYRRKIFIRL